MIVYGEDVKICVQNLAQWIPQLQSQVMTILNSAPGTDLEKPVRTAAALAEQIINGTDLDGNGKVDPLAGEGGTQTAYEYAYYMADMPILPVGVITPTANASGIITTPTATSTFSQVLPAPTKTRDSVQQNTSIPQPTSAQPTSPPIPTNEPKPTKVPKESKTPKP